MGLFVRHGDLDGAVVNLRSEGGVIAELGADVVARPDDDVVDARGMAIVGGLVNGHGHAAMTLFRGYGSDLQLQEWLTEKIWPAEMDLTAEDCYWGTRLAAIEMIRSGTTHFHDMYWHPEAVARASEDAGLRATVGAPLLDSSGPTKLREDALASLDALDSYGPLITPSLTPHAIYTVGRDSLEWVAETAAERDLVVHLHLSESRREVDDWMADHHDRPAIYCDELGLLGPKTILAHGCHLDQTELETIAERYATVVTNPCSNLKLAAGAVFPYASARACGVPVGLGTDGAASNNSLDLLAELKMFALIQKHSSHDPTALPAAEALAIAQGRRSAVLGGVPVAVGAPADFLLIDTSLPEMNPGALVDNLVYAASGAVVDTTVVAGAVLMRHRHIDGVDEVIGRARECAERLTAGG